MSEPGSGETLQQRLTADLALWMHNTWSSVKHTDAAKVDQDCKDDADSVMYGFWPLIEAALLAARVGTAEEIAQAIKADYAIPGEVPDYYYGLKVALDIVARSAGTEKP